MGHGQGCSKSSQGTTAVDANRKDVAVMTEPDVAEPTMAEDEDATKCRICNGGGEADD